MIIHEDSSSENRQTIALASLALQIAKKLFQKGNLEN